MKNVDYIPNFKEYMSSLDAYSSTRSSDEHLVSNEKSLSLAEIYPGGLGIYPQTLEEPISLAGIYPQTLEEPISLAGIYPQTLEEFISLAEIYPDDLGIYPQTVETSLFLAKIYLNFLKDLKFQHHQALLRGNNNTFLSSNDNRLTHNEPMVRGKKACCRAPPIRDGPLCPTSKNAYAYLKTIITH